MPANPDQTAIFSLTALLILLVPGAAWMVWSPRRADFLSRLAEAVGISISLTVIAALAGLLFDFHFTRPLLTALYAVFFALILAGMLHRLIRSRTPGWNARQVLPGLIGLAGVAGLAAWRLYQARGLVLPAWVDSVHHTLIVRVILENGGLPQTLAPYLPVDFSYHYGFHALTALFAGITQVEPAAAILWFGQILNALIALSVYRLGMEIWGDWRRAVLAALLVGFGFQMPAYYLTWGRYTLITGLLMLPLAMAALLRLSRQPRDVSAWISAVLLTAGVALSHYTALLLLGFYTVILVLLRWLERPQPDENGVSPSRWQGAWQPALGAAAGVLIAAPWLLQVWLQLNTQAEINFVPPLDSGQAGYMNYILYLLGPQHSAVWLAVAGAGMVWALWRKTGRVLGVWALILAVMTLPWGLRLGPFRPDHMAIVLFLPASLLAADFVIHLMELSSRLPRVWLRRGVQAGLILAALAGIGWGGWQTRDILNSSTVFADQADLEALEWVRENTPLDARFIINTTPWMGRTYRGVDGGYWLLPYAGKQTILPPVMYTYGSQDYVGQTERWAQQLNELTTCDADFWRLVEEFDAGYLYLRQGRGSLQPEALAACPRLVNVYRRGGVHIYEIVR